MPRRGGQRAAVDEIVLRPGRSNAHDIPGAKGNQWRRPLPFSFGSCRCPAALLSSSLGQDMPANYSMAMRSCRRDSTSRNAGWTVKSVLTDRYGRHWTGAPPCEPGRRPAVHPVITDGGVCGAQPRGPDGATTSPRPPASCATGQALLTVDGRYVKFATEDCCSRAKTA